MSLGKVISRQRRLRKMTQAELADLVGISTRGVVRIEGGQTSLTVDVLGRFADALAVRPSELLRLSEETSESEKSKRENVD